MECFLKTINTFNLLCKIEPPVLIVHAQKCKVLRDETGTPWSKINNILLQYLKYNEDLNTYHSESGIIWNPNLLTA